MKVHFVTAPRAPLTLDGARFTTGPDVSADTELLVAGRPTRDQLAASDALHTLLIPWAGLPPATRDLLADFPHLKVHNIHFNAPMVAEMAVGLMIAAAKRMLPADRALRANDWRPRYAPLPQMILDGKTALVLGWGEMGQRIGAGCRALGMAVMATRRRPSDEPHVYPPGALHALLPRAHVVFVCVPATAETINLLSTAEFALMPPGAVLVNMGRAVVVDEAALYHALTEGTLGGAAFDVWYHYPANESEYANTPPTTAPLGELDNFVMSPHRSAGPYTEETEQRRVQRIKRSLEAALLGEPLPHPVDVGAGY